MKIAFLGDGIYLYAAGAPSAVGGAERQQWLVALALRKAGWQVVVGVRDALAPNRRINIEGVEFVGVGHKQFLWAWYRFLLSERPDWWYWRCASHLLGVAVLIAKTARVQTIFAVAFDNDVNVRSALFERPRWWPLYALGLAWSDRIFVQNEKQRLSLRRRWRAKTWKVSSISPERQTAIPHSKRAQYVAWVAMFREFKRPDLLVEIARKAPDILFVVCGGPTTFSAEPGYGEYIAETLRHLPNVDYRGQVSPDEATRIMGEAALFLSTSDEEGFPNTFLQAWSAGTPVISLRIDPDHIVKRHALGKVSGSVEQAIADIRDLIDSPQRRQAVACRATRYVANYHSPSAVVRIFEAAVCGIVSVPAVRSHTANPV